MFWEEDEQAERPAPPRGTPLHYAAFCGLHDFVKILTVERPQDVDSQSFSDEATPLHLASEEGHVDVARILVEQGADVTAQDKDGSTPLHRASERGHLDLARFLVEHGANAAAKNKYGWTPLDRASERGHLDVKQFLVKLRVGADSAAQDKEARV